ncbi:adenylyl-sulfate kinase 3-like [Cornus florida]|uniref:adenylyl-sulfate kinase 3-like n=1 Tax=Cornus florida TaxID=4283 RepID=UPI00289D6B11|nr:adenylyl-sulfate kinase 3-like [Cornus florida]XP_059624015.1 adenylyl-sulfate kinase 3-like [Cornus florida]
MTAVGNRPLFCYSLQDFGSDDLPSPKLGFLKLSVPNCDGKSLGLHGALLRSSVFSPIKAMKDSRMPYVNGKVDVVQDLHYTGFNPSDDKLNIDSNGKSIRKMSTIRNSTNIVWHKCSVEKIDRQELLQQKGCVIWITGLSGSGKSTLACALSRGLHARGKLTYILDGDNVRHGLNSDLSFKAEDRAENIRRVGEVAKLFADAGVICIASLISPYRTERDACRALLPEGDFIEVFMDVPLRVCEARDPKGLYKLARAGKIKGFTGIDDPYETPLNSEIVLEQKGEVCTAPSEMAETVISYLEQKGYLKA